MTTPSPSDSSSSPAAIPSPLFLPPRKPHPSSSPLSLPSSLSEPGTSSPTTGLPTDDWSGEPASPAPSDPGPSGSSAPPSTAGDLPEGSLGSRGELANAAAAGVVMLTTAAHEMLADEVGQSVGLYLAEDKEVESFSAAAAGLVSRRVPAGVGSPDVTDLMKLAFVVGGYVARQFKLKRWVKQFKAAAITAAPADDVDPYGPGTGA